MKIAVGSTNIVKIDAVKEVIRDYPHVADAEIVSVNVPSEISEQPMTLEETIQGAKNRARNAFEASPGSTYGFGIESGLFPAPGTLTGFLEATVCIIYDGKNYHSGLSCGFEIPPQVLGHVVDDKMDLSQACFEAGLTSNAKLGSAEGLIGLLTKGRINRKEYTKLSVKTALIHIENGSLYGINPVE